jgi:hypothetical protein
VIHLDDDASVGKLADYRREVDAEAALQVASIP